MSDSRSSSEHDALERLAESVLARFRGGERPSLTEYTTKYPELAEQIRELFPVLVLMEQGHSTATDPAGPLVTSPPPSAPPKPCERSNSTVVCRVPHSSRLHRDEWELSPQPGL